MEHIHEDLDTFLLWCKNNGMKFSDKIEVVADGTSHRYGVLAKTDIYPGDVLVQIPRHLLLTPSNGKISKQLKIFSRYLQCTGKSLSETSGWIPLILTLMYEYLDPASFWRPYLDLVPKCEEFGHPIFWTDHEREQELKGLSLYSEIKADLTAMKHEYNDYALDFITQHSGQKSSKMLSFDLYKQMVAFIMSYSFTVDLKGPVMVPMADVFNHHSHNNANLVYKKTCLRMVATEAIEKGAEIFNTFGKLDNSQLLHSYGFTEGITNPYDTVRINFAFLIDTMLTQHISSNRLMKWKLFCLRKLGTPCHYNDGFTFSAKGLVSGPNPMLVLQVLHLKKHQFMRHFRSLLCGRAVISRWKLCGRAVISRWKTSSSKFSLNYHVKGISKRKGYTADGKILHASRLSSIIDVDEEIIDNQCEEEGQLLYGFDEMRVSFEEKWRDTLSRAASTMLSNLSTDVEKDTHTLLERHLMARTIRLSEQKILQKIVDCK